MNDSFCSFSHEKAYEMVKTLLGISESNTEKDTQAEFALDSAEELVKNYCNIKEIPAGLSSTVVKMAVDIFRNEEYGLAQKPQTAKAVTMGDTKTEFASVQSESYEASLLKCYQKHLNRYRRVVFC